MAEKEKPTCWTYGWSMDIELGFAGGKYLPRKAALILYPEYFDEHGEPIKDMLPFGYEIEKKPRGYGKNLFRKRVEKWLNTKEITDTECMERQHIQTNGVQGRKSNAANERKQCVHIWYTK